MICFKGKTFNIHEPLVCRIVLPSSQIYNESKDFVFVDNLEAITNSYAGIIINSQNTLQFAYDIPIFQFYTNVNSLNEGDILFIEPSGKATKFFDSSSSTNSILITEKCNCNCIMCPQPTKQQDDFDWVSLSAQCIELMNPEATECIGITGGEPTVEWEGLIKTIEACKLNLPSTQIQLLSNGHILEDYAKAEELAKIAGDNLFICVPLYSDIDTIHDKLCGLRGAFWNCLAGIYNIDRTGIFLELRIVITKENYKRLPQFAEFVYRTIPFVGHVAFMGMEPIGNALKNIEKLWIDPADHISQLEKAVRILWRRDISVSLFNFQLCTLPEKLWPLAKKSISEWKIIYLDECLNCFVKSKCGGFFFSAKNFKSRKISPIFN